MAALDSGDVLVASVGANGQIEVVVEPGGLALGPPAASLPNSLTNDPVSLTALPGGRALLAFRGQDNFPYFTLYSGGSWSAVAPLFSPNLQIDNPSAVAPGCGADAVMAYVSGGAVYRTELSGDSWSPAVLVGGTGMQYVAVATQP
jgi:hypothetical protein